METTDATIVQISNAELRSDGDYSLEHLLDQAIIGLAYASSALALARQQGLPFPASSAPGHIDIARRQVNASRQD